MKRKTQKKKHSGHIFLNRVHNLSLINNPVSHVYAEPVSLKLGTGATTILTPAQLLAVIFLLFLALDDVWLIKPIKAAYLREICPKHLVYQKEHHCDSRGNSEFRERRSVR